MKIFEYTKNPDKKNSITKQIIPYYFFKTGLRRGRYDLYLQQGNYYIIRKHKCPHVFEFEDNKHIPKILNFTFWNEHTNVPFIFSGEVITAYDQFGYPTKTYFGFFSTKTKFWLLKKQLKFIKKLR